MEERIVETSTTHSYLVYVEKTTAVGYCYANLWKKRYAYGSTIENSRFIMTGLMWVIES